MESAEELPQLYTHSRRPRWGLAILAWQGPSKRRFQFEDGKARTFKKGFFGLLEEVDRPLDVTEDIVEDLERMLDISRARRELVEEARSKGKNVIRFDDQVKAFKHIYPKGGFEDPIFRAKVRGEGQSKRLKSHLDPAVAEARAAFDEGRLRTAIRAGEFGRIFEDAKAVTNGVSLTSGAKHYGYFAALPEARWEAFATALYDMLYGAEKLAGRFDRLVAALDHGDGGLGWPLATAFAGLAQPDRHVCIKPSVFRMQAKWMAPRLSYSAAPSGDLYARFLKMSRRVAKRLTDAELAPNDLLDVHAFIWTTLRPNGRKVLEELKQQR